MRAALALLVVAACSPDIQSGSYYCGADEECPPGLACDGATDICVTPVEVEPFTCAEGSPLRSATCGAGTLMSNGCVTSGAAHDTFSFATDATCTMTYETIVSMPVAFMPLGFTVTDGAGAVVATGAPCNPVHGGLTDMCGTFTGGAGQTYTIDVAADDGATNCDGACAFNRFSISVLVTRP